MAATATPERLSFCYSILLHVALVIGLIIIASVLQTKKNTLNLAGGRTVVTLNSKEIVQATAISSESVDQQVAQFDQKQQQLKQEKLAKEQLRQQKIEAIEEKIATAHAAEVKRQEELKAAEIAKQKALAEAKLKAEAEARAKEMQKQKALAQAEKEKVAKAEKAEKEKQEKALKAQQEAQKLAEAKKAQAEKEAKEAKEAKAAREAKAAAARKAALDALRQSALNDLNAQSAEAHAQSATEKALQAYASAYKARIEAVWIMDDCRKISADHLPTVMVTPGSNPTISVSSGSAQCDRSLLLAFKNAQAPSLPQDARARELIAQGIDFKFGQQG
ncbi:cell envelope integrity protein TolA [Cysteiniphilum sp. QT6929]|uniref:cell envelope integrity protein TolA n=1 Tax=Cysteiniphilum sp. QT6929 TaxID=2975055 RepID=UPI0024B3323B|nr:cell envelope integrity protein TolA [Cysteiniphilum sp. QT6929]WHN66532.1 cell envelope integrity protein TolA [Cysteiniphilum sp. QT6929]